ncbi:MAG: hypothetical protein WD049_03460, partial [Candidatus Paceibacterota bacterium]
MPTNQATTPFYPRFSLFAPTRIACLLCVVCLWNLTADRCVYGQILPVKPAAKADTPGDSPDNANSPSSPE